MFHLNKIAICGLFFHADHNVRGLDNSSPAFNDVVSAKQRSHELIQGDSRKLYGNDDYDWREDWNYDTYFYNKYYEKCLSFNEFNDDDNFGELIDCDDEDSHFAIEKLSSSFTNKGVWKIRHIDDLCVGVKRIKEGQKLALFDCDKDDDKILWILGERDDYDQIRPALDDDLCVRNTELSEECGKNDEKNLFKNKKMQMVYKKIGDTSVCRTDNWGKGYNGNDYDLYFWTSKDRCEEKCTDSSSCKGFEWNEQNHCEIWKKSNDKNVDKNTSWSREHNSRCFWKIEQEYRIIEDRRCRTDRGKTGSHKEEYFMYKNEDSDWSKTDCKDYCSDNFWCTGFEYNPNGDCEVWFYDSDKFEVSLEEVNGAYCYWKN